MLNSDYQKCTKTVMDNIADPDIFFDEQGISNYWYQYQEVKKRELIHGKEGEQKWESTVKKLKEEGKSKKFDCIIGVSGGVDSTYVAYLVKQAGLKPLIVHFDNGWNSEIAVQNINNIINYLDSEFYTLVVDWDEFRDLQRAYLKAGVIDIEALTDHAIYGTLYKLAAKYKVKYVIGGLNHETESIMPPTWNYSKIDHFNIKDIHRQYGELPLKTYPLFDTLKKKYYGNMMKLQFMLPLNWAPYNKEKVKSIISSEIGWKDYGGKHHESIFTKFYQNYILPKKFNVDKRKPHLSNLICSEQITREQALEELNAPLYKEEELKQDKEFVVKKLGFTLSEFDDIMKEPPRSHYDFETEGPIEQHYPFLGTIKKIYKAFTR